MFKVPHKVYQVCWGRVSSGEEVRGRKSWGRKSRFKKNGDGEDYQAVGNFIHPWIIFLLAGSLVVFVEALELLGRLDGVHGLGQRRR